MALFGNKCIGLNQTMTLLYNNNDYQNKKRRRQKLVREYSK